MGRLDGCEKRTKEGKVLLLELQEKTKLRSLLLNSKTIIYQLYDFK